MDQIRTQIAYIRVWTALFRAADEKRGARAYLVGARRRRIPRERRRRSPRPRRKERERRRGREVNGRKNRPVRDRFSGRFWPNKWQTAPNAPLLQRPWAMRFFTATLPRPRPAPPLAAQDKAGKGREPIYVTEKGVGKVRFPPLLSCFFINLI